MKLKIDATPEELSEKAPALLGKLAGMLQFINPEIADTIFKAVLPQKEHELKHPVLRDLQKKISAIYADHLDRMIADIGKVLDKSTRKSEVSHGGNDQNDSGSGNSTAGLSQAVQHGAASLRRFSKTESANAFDGGIPGEMENSLSSQSRFEGYQEGGSRDTTKKSYELPSIKARKATPEELAGAKTSQPLRHDHTKKIVEQDLRSHNRVKIILMRRGYVESDFEEGGPLYGYSVNELIGLIRGKE
jgi:hypothetical protein